MNEQNLDINDIPAYILGIAETSTIQEILIDKGIITNEEYWERFDRTAKRLIEMDSSNRKRYTLLEVFKRLIKKSADE